MAGWWRKRWPRMVGFDVGFVPQVLCAAEPGAAGAVLAAGCPLVVCLATGVGFWQARDAPRRSLGRSICLGAVLGYGGHIAVFGVLQFQ